MAKVTKIPFYFDSLNSESNKDKNSINGFSREFVDEKIFDSLNHISFTNYITFLKDFDLDNDPYFKKYNRKKDDRYFYPIFWPQVESDVLIDNLVLPEIVLNDIRNQKAKILLINAYEGYSMDSFQLDANQISSKNGISFDSIVFVNGNLKIVDNKNHVYINFWESIIEHFQYNFNGLTDDLIKNICGSNLRKNKFICLQRRPHSHRIATFVDLYNLRNDGILTLGIGDTPDVFKKDFEYFSDKFPEKIKGLKKLKHLLPYEYDVDLQKNNPTHDDNVEKYINSYLHIVSETYFFNKNNRLFFSEKIFKPVLYMQPFVLFSETGSLEAFRNLGFKTFPSIIDESYDEIINDKQRYETALLSIKKFISQDKKEIHQQIRSILPDLIHNYGLLCGRRITHSASAYAKLYNILYNL